MSDDPLTQGIRVIEVEEKAFGSEKKPCIYYCDLRRKRLYLVSVPNFEINDWGKGITGLGMLQRVD